MTLASAHTLRQRIREELHDEIKQLARAQLATEGAGSLSLRAIARDLQMASSAIYRYFASRDDLLTALIIDGYTAIAETVEQADRSVRQDDYLGRWVAVCRALRAWALAHPHEYSLVYGSPVPGYQAPGGTVAPATRDKITYGRIVSDAYRAGVLRPPEGPPTSVASFAADAERLRAVVMPQVPDSVVIAALTTWSGMFGMLNLELFGHFNYVIDDRDTLFDHGMTSLGRMLGLAG
ncbi:MAG TPA: TetR/AcrR family transcriptional regulator [Actinocrinis sp.]|nr:TetR/AcrR family transcriptional regulator [Actinocrinis sp.]